MDKKNRIDCRKKGHMSEENSITRSAVSFFSGTLLSRVSGLGREVVTAFTFGASPAIAAFMIAFRFANLLRRLFGESALSSTVIPYFETIRTESPQKGAEFFRDLFASMTMLLGVLILAVEGGLWGLLQWGGLSEGGAEIVFLSMLMLPALLFICQFALSCALLQCEKQFFLTGFAPTAFNVVWMIAAWQLRGSEPHTAAGMLASAVVLAFFMQLAMCGVPMVRHLRSVLSWKSCLSFSLFSSQVRALFKPFFLGILGIGAVQINSALDALFARFASSEGPAYLWYAVRIEQLPIALLGVALASALLPSLSRSDQGAQKELIGFSLRRAFNFLFPCTVAMVVLGASGINLLYGRGAFTEAATAQTTYCLWGYAAGLVPAVFVLLLATVCFARKDFRTPTVAAVASVALNIALNALFVFGFGWGAFSIALATSASAFLNAAILARSCRKTFGKLLPPTAIPLCVKVVVCTLIAGITTLFLGHFLTGDPTLTLMLGRENYDFTRNFFDQILQSGVLLASFVLIFFSYAWTTGADEVLSIIRKKV
jgi:putative peptidoglycan lipid II flippase